MLPAAEEEILSPLAASSASGEERVFSFAAGVGLAALETHQGENRARGKKPHQGILSRNCRLHVSAMWAKWSGTHQDSGGWRSKTVLGIALDANGNTLSDPSGKSYTWDFENRLVQAVVPGTNGGTTMFKYDPFGRRIQKSGPIGTTNYLYDGPNLLEEVDGSGNVLARYTEGTSTEDEPLSELRSGTTSYYEQDALGSVSSVSNSAGALANTYTYDSSGKRTASTGSITNPLRYTGREFDSETGLYYNRARYYDPSSGRFLSEDPIRINGGIDYYVYVLNDPVDNDDPDGLRTEVCCRPLHSFPGRLGYNHCYVLITSDDNPWNFHTYGLHREDDNTGVLFPGGARPVMDSKSDVGGTCSSVQDATPCKERSFVERAMSDTNCPSCGSNYWPFTTNSNYWTRNAIQNGGMTPPDFPGGQNSPGYGPLPGPQPDPPWK
jgi:RHS repeat-associated protein